MCAKGGCVGDFRHMTNLYLLGSGQRCASFVHKSSKQSKKFSKVSGKLSIRKKGPVTETSKNENVHLKWNNDVKSRSKKNKAF